MARSSKKSAMTKMEAGITGDRDYDFTLVLTGITKLTRVVVDALFEAGCSDATISLRYGAVYLTFTRSAPTLKSAILSAIRDVRRAKIGADVLRVDVCDLVTQAEIARRIHRSRQAVHQYITGARGPRGFPAPVCNMATADGPLWFWCEVAAWLWRNKIIGEEVGHEALFLAMVNDVLDLRHKRQFGSELVEEIQRIVDPR